MRKLGQVWLLCWITLPGLLFLGGLWVGAGFDGRVVRSFIRALGEGLDREKERLDREKERLDRKRAIAEVLKQQAGG